MATLYMGDRLDNIKRKCPVCGCNVAKRMCSISYVLPEGNPLPRQYDVVCCSKCGFSYANVGANQNVYNEYYENYNIYAEDSQIKYEYSKKWRGGGQRPIIRSIKEVVPRDAAILDVGCGGGGLLEALKEAGYQNICGMDPSSASIASLQKRGINGIVGNIFSDHLPLHMPKYDYAISSGVIEHIYDLHGYLKNMKNLLKEGSGQIIVAAPAIEKMNENAPIANHFNHEHINYFSSISLNNLLMTEGFVANGEVTYCEEYGEGGLIGFYKLAPAQRQADLQYETVSQAAIENYLTGYNDDDLGNTIKLLYEMEQSIIVWGVGSLAMQLFGRYPDLLERVKYFVDNNTAKQGMVVCNKEICAPERINNEEENSIILICSIKNVDDIQEEISCRGWDMKNNVIIIEK